MRKVNILSGGMAGLTAANELLLRGYTVDIYERNNVFGGKARSMTPAPSTPGGRPGLPGEHGFRFFPGFYKHIDDTMGRIKTTGTRTVLDELVVATEITLAEPGKPPVRLPAVAPAPGDFDGFIKALTTLLLDPKFDVPDDEKLLFIKKIVTFLCSGHLRRTLQYDLLPWLDYIEAAGKSQAYVDLLGNGLTRSLVAMQPQRGSTFTVGTILIQIILDLLNFHQRADRVLDGPTSEVWIEPWIAHLNTIGAGRLTLHPESSVTGFQFSSGCIQSVTIQTASGQSQVGSSADHFLCALPLDVMQELLSGDPAGLKTTAD